MLKKKSLGPRSWKYELDSVQGKSVANVTVEGWGNIADIEFDGVILDDIDYIQEVALRLRFANGVIVRCVECEVEYYDE